MPPSEETHRWCVPAHQAGERLDRALVEALPTLSRSRLQALIKGGRVRVEGREARKPGMVVGEGASIEVDLPRAPAAPPPEESRRRLRVLWSDDDLAVVDKPAGLLSHRGEGAEEVSLGDLARSAFGDLPSLQGADRPGIVHRLDRDTSGVMVLGLTRASLEGLMRQFREREVSKRYRALVLGEPRFDSDWIEEPIGRSKRHPDRMTLTSLDEGGRAARTFYTVLERFGAAASLACEPKTGRTHQIRVHLSSIGLPVLGDRVYRSKGGRPVQLGGNAPVVKRQMLHAERLRFAHPRSGELMTFEAPVPGDFGEVLEWLRGGGR